MACDWIDGIGCTPDQAFPLTALAEGKHATAPALVRTGPGEKPPASIRPAELNGPLARYGLLRAAPPARSAAVPAVPGASRSG